MINRTSDRLNKGDRYAPLTLQVSRELNEQFLKALDIQHERYLMIVHPGVLFNFCSITQSPSFNLMDDIAAVGAKFNCTMLRPLKVGETIEISWVVTDVYEKRSRIYQVCEVKVVDKSGDIIFARSINNTFIGGEYLEKRVAWEKERGFRRALNTSEFPREGYEIVGIRKDLSLEKQRIYSGGLPGPNWPNRNIHTDREVSIRSGIGKPIASGLMFESYLAELMISFFGEAWFTSGELRTAAIDMAGDGDTVFPKATVRARDFDGSREELFLGVWCENQYGNKIMVGTAKGVFRSDQ